MTTHNKLERYKDLLLQRAILRVQIVAEMQAFRPCRNAINCLPSYSRCNTCKKRDAIQEAGAKRTKELREKSKQLNS